MILLHWLAGPPHLKADTTSRLVNLTRRRSFVGFGTHLICQCSLGHPVDNQSAAPAMVLNVSSLDCDFVKASSHSLSQPSFMEKSLAHELPFISGLRVELTVDRLARFTKPKNMSY